MSSPRFDNSYARLPEHFFSTLPPTAVAQPALIKANVALADQLGIDNAWLQSEAGLLALSGNGVPEGAEPLAAVYAGHQFGSYNPQLGDGRALLLGEIIAPNGRRFDIQLKGSGPTPYSRGGDGRSPLGPVLREYILSEAMHALGVPTTRALAAVSTGEAVMREDALPGAVLTRVASSHIRIGTVQFFAAHRDTDALRTLTEHVLARHYPDQMASDNSALALLNAVIDAQAKLVAHWQLLGFIHGVMNTDNMLLCGETIDYGPCAFMDTFDPAKVYSSIDHGGRYAYRNQPGIAHWNLSQLAQALLPILDDDQEQAVAAAQAAINRFPDQFLQAHAEGLANKLGLETLNDDDTALVEDLFTLMAQEHLDFTQTFRQLADLVAPGKQARLSDDFPLPEAMSPWLSRWQARLGEDGQTPQQRQAQMYAANPAFIPRNHQVEAAIAAGYREDYSVFEALTHTLQAPYEYNSTAASYAAAPQPEEEVRQTFCGT